MCKYLRPHPKLPDPALMGARGEGTFEFPLLLGEDQGEVFPSLLATTNIIFVCCIEVTRKESKSRRFLLICNFSLFVEFVKFL